MTTDKARAEAAEAKLARVEANVARWQHEAEGLREAVLTLATEIRLRIIERESIALGEPDAWIKRSAVLKFVIEERLAHPIAKAAVERAGGDR